MHEESNSLSALLQHVSCAMDLCGVLCDFLSFSYRMNEERLIEAERKLLFFKSGVKKTHVCHLHCLYMN